MKRFWMILLCTFLLQGTALAWEGFGGSLGYGQAQDDIDIYRLGIKKDFSGRYFETDAGFLSGYYEVSLNYWDHPENNVTALAVSPVFAYYFGQPESILLPYLEAGIGGALLSDTRIGNRDMSTTFQFEDRIGMGIKYDRFDVNFRYMHYSNASIKKPNDGIDILIFTASFQF